MGLFISAADTTQKVSPIGKHFSLEDMQTIVDGHIEQVDLSNGMIMMVDEDGREKNRPINKLATQMAKDILPPNYEVVGDVLILHPDELE